MSEPAAEAAPLPSTAIPRSARLDGVRDMLRVRRDMLGVVRDRFDRYGPVVFQRMPLMHMVSLSGPEAARFLLLDRERVFSARRSWNAIMGRIFTNGLLLRDGADHRHHRRIMRGAFQTGALRSYLEEMNPQVEQALTRWGEGSRGGGVPLEAFPAYKTLTLDLAAKIFLGIELGAEADRMRHAFEAAVAASMSVVRLSIPGLEFHAGLRGREHMEAFFQRLLDERRDGKGTDMLSRLARAENEEGERLSDREVVDHMIFLMMAAHDTTTSALTSLTYELARHPEWQERVREEVMGFGKRWIEYDDLLQVPVTTRCIHETLRRYPPLSTIPRVSTKPFVFGGYEIPADVMVVVYPIEVHHHEEWWERPFDFDPDRFAAPRKEHERHSHLFIPFGGGDHMCLGLRFAEMQIRAILFQLVQRYRFGVEPGYRMPVQQAPISRPMDGLPIRLQPL